MAATLAATFSNDMPGQIATLKQLVAAGDCIASGKQAHRIKGAAANMGCSALSRAASAMEQAGKAQNLQALQETAATIDGVLEETMRAIEHEFAPPGNNG